MLLRLCHLLPIPHLILPNIITQFETIRLRHIRKNDRGVFAGGILFFGEIGGDLVNEFLEVFTLSGHGRLPLRHVRSGFDYFFGFL